MDRQGWGGVVIGLGGTVVMAGVPVAFPPLAIPAITFGLVVILIGVVVALWGRALATPLLVPMWALTFKARDRLPFRRLIKLNEAVRAAYDGLQDRVAGNAARQLGTTPENYIYHALRADEIWGTRPGAKRLVRLDTGFIVNAVLDMQTNTLSTHDETYENVHILRRDLREKVKYLREWDQAFAQRTRT